MGHVFGQSFILRPSHKFQSFANARFRRDVEIWGLLELHRQSLLQSSVKNRIAGRIHEVSEQDGIFFREPGRVRACHIKNAD